jgi:regulatory protein
MKVTRLQPSTRHPGLVTVFLDGARFALLPVEDVRALSLAEGALTDQGQREALQAAAERRRAYDAAVRLLAVRGRSSQELVSRLRRKGLAQDAALHALGRLESEGLVNDATYAREYARAKADRGYGPARILAELAAKGVSRRDAELAVAQTGQDDEAVRQDRLLALARKRARQLAAEPPEVGRRRLVRFLLRRGFATGEVLGVVRRLTGGPPSGDDGP